MEETTGRDERIIQARQIQGENLISDKKIHTQRTKRQDLACTSVKQAWNDQLPLHQSSEQKGEGLGL